MCDIGDGDKAVIWLHMPASYDNLVTTLSYTKDHSFRLDECSCVALPMDSKERRY